MEKNFEYFQRKMTPSQKLTTVIEPSNTVMDRFIKKNKEWRFNSPQMSQKFDLVSEEQNESEVDFDPKIFKKTQMRMKSQGMLLKRDSKISFANYQNKSSQLSSESVDDQQDEEFQKMYTISRKNESKKINRLKSLSKQYADQVKQNKDRLVTSIKKKREAILKEEKFS